MSININPCTPCTKQFSSMQDVQSCCYNICSDWMGPGQNVIGTECYKICQQCTVPYWKEKKETQSASLRLPPPPVVYNNVPIFFPELLHLHKGDMDKALEDCVQKCCGNDVNLPDSCAMRCKLDYQSAMDGGVISNNNVGSMNSLNNNMQNNKKNKKSSFEWRWYYTAIIIFVVIIHMIFLYIIIATNHK